MIKVKKLIAELKKVDQEAVVVMASDAEGNSYRPFYIFCDGNYSPLDNEVCPLELTEQDIKDGFTEENLGINNPDNVKAVVFFPED